MAWDVTEVFAHCRSSLWVRYIWNSLHYFLELAKWRAVNWVVCDRRFHCLLVFRLQVLSWSVAATYFLQIYKEEGLCLPISVPSSTRPADTAWYSCSSLLSSQVLSLVLFIPLPSLTLVSLDYCTNDCPNDQNFITLSPSQFLFWGRGIMIATFPNPFFVV